MLQQELDLLSDFTSAICDLYWSAHYDEPRIDEDAIRQARETISRVLLQLAEDEEWRQRWRIAAPSLVAVHDQRSATRAIPVSPADDSEAGSRGNDGIQRMRHLARRVLRENLEAVDFQFLDALAETLAGRVTSALHEQVAILGTR